MLAQHSAKYSTYRTTLRRKSFGALILRKCLYIVLALAAGAMQLNAQNLHAQFDGNDAIGTFEIENCFWPKFGNDWRPSTAAVWSVGHLIAAPENALSDSTPFGETNARGGDRLISQTFSAGTAAPFAPQQPAILELPPEQVQPLKSQTAMHPANEIIAGIPSQAVQFASWAAAAGQFVEQQIRQASLSYQQSDSSSDLARVSLVGKLDTNVHPAAWLSTQDSSDRSAAVFHLDTVTDDMVTDNTVKDVVGGQSGFFSRAQWGLNYDYWRVESGIGIAWTTLLDRGKTLVDLGSRDNIVWNMSVLYFPLGDIPWRPFVLLGTGLTQLNTFGSTSQANTATLYTGISHKN